MALRVCEPLCGEKFCPQGDTRGKEFLSRVCGQKWVPPGAWRFCDTLKQDNLFFIDVQVWGRYLSYAAKMFRKKALQGVYATARHKFRQALSRGWDLNARTIRLGNKNTSFDRKDNDFSRRFPAALG